jgi:dihydroorotate dehydrogenase
VYQGPALIDAIKAGLVARMATEGADGLAGFVGRDARSLAAMAD